MSKDDISQAEMRKKDIEKYHLRILIELHPSGMSNPHPRKNKYKPNKPINQLVIDAYNKLNKNRERERERKRKRKRKKKKKKKERERKKERRRKSIFFNPLNLFKLDTLEPTDPC